MRRIIIFATLSLFSLAGTVVAPIKTYAVTASDWRAGNIVSDAVFTDGNAMSTAEIQSFLERRLPYCDKFGTKTSELGGGTRAQYGAANGNPTPFTCITSYYEVPKTSPGNYLPVNNYGKYNANGSPFIPAGSKSAAQLISDAARRYSISPKALIIKVATESPGPLTSDEWPFMKQYYYAMGAHCPDSGPGGSANCDANYAGFSIQIDEAAKLLRGYLDNMTQSWWPYKKPYQTNSVLWNVVQRGCGAGDVYIESKATAALYTYTPYQPNQAALNNMYGTGDNCSAYGNRNFWRVWNDWFGPTIDRFTSMTEPRWMQMRVDTRKIDPITGQEVDDILVAGRQLKFVSKITTKDGPCLRTASDTNNGIRKCILMSNLTELLISYTTLSSAEQTMTTRTPTYKQNLRTNALQTGFPIEGVRQYAFNKKTVIGGVTYYITRYDSANGTESGIPSTNLLPASTYVSIPNTYLRLSQNTRKVIPFNGAAVDNELAVDTRLTFTSQTQVNGVWYYRTAHDTKNSYDKGIPETALTSAFFNFVTPRWMQTTRDTSRVNPFTGQQLSTLPTKTQIFFTSKFIPSNGSAYYRSREDSVNDTYAGVSSTDLEEIPYDNFVHPRKLKLVQATRKMIPSQNIPADDTLPQGMTRFYNSKILVNGVWYYRTEVDSLADNDKAIPASLLSEV